MPFSPNTDWRTSKHNVAPDLHWSGADAAYNTRTQLKAEIQRTYPGAIVIGDATYRYNCHAFVHAASHAWFNDISPFLRDDYYPFTPGNLQLNDAVVYVKSGQITHSGFIIQLSGNTILRIRSKWGALPLVEHAPTNVPAIYGNISYYLRRRPALVGDSAEREGVEEVVSPVSLLDQMLSDRYLQDLWLASTPEVADMIISGWPEFTGLLLHAAEAEQLIADRLPTADETQLPVLLALAKRTNSLQVLRVLAEQIVKEDTGVVTGTQQSLLDTYSVLASRLLDKQATFNQARSFLEQ